MSQLRDPAEPGSGDQTAGADTMRGPTASTAAPAPEGGDDRFAERYRVEHLLGKGGMGEVRLCIDAAMGRTIALKTLREDSGGARRFVREARMQGRLEHPAVVPVYDMGQAHGLPYFTMKRIVGTTLADVITKLVAGDEATQREFGRRRLLSDFVQVCQAVAYAHDHGVIHRDLKPANVMLGAYGEVYVLDWGVAKELDGSATELEPGPTRAAEGETAAGAVLGTLGYMPPEQLEGGGATVDRRADVYALGAILYELLTWQALHPRRPTSEMIASTLEGADARASLRAPDREVPPELEAVCVRATASDPSARFADVGALRDAVERYLDGDRDQQARRALAREHAARAAQLELRSDDDNDARAQAVREAGRALALDPDNREAFVALANLLRRPPRRVPEEVEARLREDELQESRRQAKVGAVAALGWFAFLVLPLAMGMLEWVSYGIIIGLMLVIVALSVVRAIRGRPGSADVLFIALLQAVVLGAATRLFGPFMLVPGLVVATTAMFAFSEFRFVHLLIVMGCASVFVPWLLERLELLSPTYSITADAITIHARMATFSPTVTEIALVLANVGVVAMAGAAIAHARSMLNTVRRQLAVQAWQLEQIVPTEGVTGTVRALERGGAAQPRAGVASPPADSAARTQPR
ncbi:MAG: protein kinase [Nannocystaceae bacterium]|nr:protein kinase [Nannocystaceae bacterium]